MGYYWNKVLKIHARRMMKKYGVTGLAQESMRAENAANAVCELSGARARQTAAEGCVLLKNDGVLPLAKEQEIAVFGRCQLDWFYVGYGSGGDVSAPYRISLVEGLNNAGAVYNRDLLKTYQEWTKIKRYAADDGWWGHWPMNYPEMPVSRAVAEKAAERAAAAVIVIGRAAGEDRENKLKKGSYYLTGKEEQMIRTVTGAFKKVVLVFNIGNIMDFSWLEKYQNKLAGILIVWQGGMESGNAVCDVLYGRTAPSGRLPDTIARNYADYPSAANFGGKEFNEYKEGVFVGYRYFEKYAKDKILFPFGYGLTYTSFDMQPVSADCARTLDDAAYQDPKSREVSVRVRVTNTGKRPGRDVVQLWCCLPGNPGPAQPVNASGGSKSSQPADAPGGSKSPQPADASGGSKSPQPADASEGSKSGQIRSSAADVKCDQPEKVLGGFAKTPLLQPGESAELTVSAAYHDLAYYDEARSAFFLEPGTYEWFAVDNNLPEQFRSPAASVQVTEEILDEQCEKACTLSSEELRRRILERMPEDVAMTGDQGYRMKDVAMTGDQGYRMKDVAMTGDQGYRMKDVAMTGDNDCQMKDAGGKITLRQFVCQLSDEELEALTRGQGMMNSPLGTPGNAGIFGGVIDSLIQKGVRSIVTSDGPAGLRLKTCCSLMPCGTLQASTFDPELIADLYECVGQEMRKLGVDVFLGPGMNIHRNPLCGRNFEYFSEDPMLSGRTAAAVVKGISRAGKVACIKHFACNNQEVMRNTNDSRVCERALREIYLRNFEICIRESHPKCLMTSYNKVNGVWSHYNYDLVNTVLRRQWGYDGTVITDWWMQSSQSPEFPALRDNAYRVRAQVDVLMPGDPGHVVSAYVSDGTLLETLGQPEGITRGELVRSAENVLRLAMDLDAADAAAGGN